VEWKKTRILQKFGCDGGWSNIYGYVERVGGIEKRIAIYELSQFTPKS